jgi:hypothetical protein
MLKDRVTEHNDTMESVLDRLLIIEERFKALAVKVELLEKNDTAPRKKLPLKKEEMKL